MSLLLGELPEDEDAYTPQEAALRLRDLAEELRSCPIPAEQFEELELLGRRFVDHIHELPVTLERLEEFVRRMR